MDVYLPIANLSVSGLVIVALGALTACAGQPRPLDEAADALAPHVSVTWPEADEPVPAVLMFSGCGGVRQVQDDYAQVIAEAGAAAVVVDSHAARSIPSALARPLVCTAALMRGQGRAADVFAAVELARSVPGERAETALARLLS